MLEAAQQSADVFDRPWSVVENTDDVPAHFNAVQSDTLERWLVKGFGHIATVAPRRWATVLVRSSRSLAQGADADLEQPRLSVVPQPDDEHPSAAADGPLVAGVAGPVPGEGTGPAPVLWRRTAAPELVLAECGERLERTDTGCALPVGHELPHQSLAGLRWPADLVPFTVHRRTLERLERALESADEVPDEVLDAAREAFPVRRNVSGRGPI